MHEGQQILIFGDGIDALRAFRERLSKDQGKPHYLIMGVTKSNVQEDSSKYVFSSSSTLARTRMKEFKSKKLSTLFFSRVGDQGINLPNANVLIQISYHKGSRRQEGQRIGRIARYSGQPAYLYSLVTPDTQEARFYRNRMRYAMDLGYIFRVMSHTDLKTKTQVVFQEENETDSKWLKMALTPTVKDNKQSDKKRDRDSKESRVTVKRKKPVLTPHNNLIRDFLRKQRDREREIKERRQQK